jgi:hypothetical protein
MIGETESAREEGQNAIGFKLVDVPPVQARRTAALASSRRPVALSASA